MSPWLLAASLLLGTRAGAAAPKEGRMESYRHAEGRFECQLPPGWRSRRDPAREKGSFVFGVLLEGPRGEGALGPKISVRYFAKGNKLFADAQAFLQAQLEPGPVSLKDESAGPIESFSLAGKPAKRFKRLVLEHVPPESLDTKEIRVSEEIVVLEHAPGFFVLIYSAPKPAFPRHKPLFDRLLESFKPL